MITLFVEENNPLTPNFYNEVINNLQFHRLTCPCGHSGCLSIHGYYQRSIKSSSGKLVFNICRVKCECCGHTHAILLCSMVPYSQVSISEQISIINNYLNDLKILFNFEMDSKERAAILPAGLPKLNSTPGLGIHEPLRQRIVMNYNLEGLSKDEGKYYISEKLKGVGCNQTIFKDATIEAILNAADETPRLINKFCNASMLIGDSQKANLITTDIVMQAINDCGLGYFIHIRTNLSKSLYILGRKLGIYIKTSCRNRSHNYETTK